MPSTSTIVTSLLAVSGLAYVAWFDYRRRHDREFRRQLRRKIKQHEKDQAKNVLSPEALRQRLYESLKENPIPKDRQDQERAFITEVGNGEAFANQGDDVSAAICFYRALNVFPNPSDILVVFKNNIRPSIYEYIIALISIEPPESLIESIGRSAAAAAQAAQPEASAVEEAAADGESAESTEAIAADEAD